MNFKLKVGLLLSLCLPLLMGTACAAQDAPQPAPEAQLEVSLTSVASGFANPLDLVNAGDESGRMFVVEQAGRIVILEQGQRLETPFLDIGERISAGGERGLLGLAFHPDYANNGRFFVNYTDPNGDTVVAEYSVSEDVNRADAASERVLLTIAQPFGNHNGGDLAFGPDGYLYIATGDGGSGGDPLNSGQSLDTHLGKLLRIDVNGGDPYAVPTDNPFVDAAGALPEIWAYGLRNPWRFSFDRDTGDLYIGDVGQNAFEEIDFQRADSAGGENYGWNVMEGFHCFNANTCDQDGLVLPIGEYPHSEGNSVTGGYVYRGEANPELAGHYVYGDFGSGRVWHAWQEDGAWTNELLLDSDLNISSFGEDEAGELYLLNFGGEIFRLTTE